MKMNKTVLIFFTLVVALIGMFILVKPSLKEGAKIKNTELFKSTQVIASPQPTVSPTMTIQSKVENNVYINDTLAFSVKLQPNEFVSECENLDVHIISIETKRYLSKPDERVTDAECGREGPPRGIPVMLVEKVDDPQAAVQERIMAAEEVKKMGNGSQAETAEVSFKGEKGYRVKLKATFLNPSPQESGKPELVTSYSDQVFVAKNGFLYSIPYEYLGRGFEWGG